MRRASKRGEHRAPVGVCQSLLAVLCGVALLATPASAETCPNEAFRTGPSAALPDCRAYELVSTGAQSDVDPIVYHGHTIDTQGDSTAVPALSGDELLWDSPFATPASNNGLLSTWISTRQSSGWAQTSQPPLSPPGVEPSGSYVTVVDATPNLSHVLLSVTPPAPEELNPAPSFAPQYILRNPDGSYTTVATGREEPGTESGRLGGFFSEGAGDIPGALAELSEDGSHVFFEARGQFAGDAHTAGDQLYEWSNGRLEVAAGDTAAATCGATLGDLHGGALSAGTLGHIASAVSQDGSRVFFESPDPWAGCAQPTDLYVRENGETIDISAAPPGVTDRGDARFIGATPDGSQVFFTSPTELTPDKTDTNPDLYEYDLETHALTRLSVGPPGYDDASVQSAVASSDGSHVYFIATGQLVPGEGAPGQPNLYAYENGAVHFIATVSPNLNLNNETGSVEAGEDGYATDDAVFVTPSGDDMVFEDTSTLTGYDNNGADEIYRYDAPTGQISCVSCNPAGAPPTPGSSTLLGGFASFDRGIAELTAAPSTHLRQRVISDDGEMVFFTSSEPLLPGAENTSAGACKAPVRQQVGCVENVYEWNDGSLSLISSGKSPLPSQLIGASANGSDVFFTSFAPLVSQDVGQFDEIYDARVDGGFPAPSSPAPCGSLEGCRGTAATPPLVAAPNSSTFSGPGNPTPPAPSSSEPAEAAKPKPLTSAQKLSKALKVCKKDKKKSKRLACERSARKKYAPPQSKAKKSAKRGGRS